MFACVVPLRGLNLNGSLLARALHVISVAGYAFWMLQGVCGFHSKKKLAHVETLEGLVTYRRKFRQVLLAAAITALVPILAGPANAQDQVNVRFSWKLKGEYGPLFLAQEEGLFKKSNLQVRLGEGAGAPAALAALIQGQEDAVVLPGVFALSAIQKGIPVKLIALYHPKTPVALISWPEKPVNKPQDLVGLTVGQSVGETGSTYLDAFLRLNGVDPAKVKRVTLNAQSRVPAFINHKLDVVSVYQTNDLPIIEQTLKTKIVVMDMVKYGLSVPGLAVVTSDANIAKKPDVMRRFLAASAQGVVDAKKDVKAATAALLKNWPNHPDERAVFQQVKATVEAIPVPQGHTIGWIDQKTIADALTLLQSTREIGTPKPIDVYYTNALLQ
jgi:NitT/TauT family transport system substrate-binding protein